MTHRLTGFALAVSLGAGNLGAAAAADAVPASSPSRPVTTVRVGGSPADAPFRAAQQKTGEEYRAARAACRKQPASERSACVKAARDKLAQDRAAAAAAHRATP